MTAASTSTKAEPWRRRLFLPSYQVGEAARYAGISARTVTDWHKVGARRTLSSRDRRAELSYLQLIEVAVVAEFRRAHVSLKTIQASRDYMGKAFASEFPFAEFRFKTDGRRLFVDLQQIEGERGKGKLMRPDQAGQLVWEDVIGRRLREFEYERHGIVIRWNLVGPHSPIVIDPRVAFGAPAVRGIPTWVVKGRWEAGEQLPDISDDFGLEPFEVMEALRFEGLDTERKGSLVWAH